MPDSGATMQADEGGFEGAKPTALLHEAVRCAAQALQWRLRVYGRVCFSLYGAFEQKEKSKIHPSNAPHAGPMVPNRAYEKPPHWSKISTHCSSFFSWRHAAGPVES